MKKIDFGFVVKDMKGNLLLNFKEDIPNWKRHVSDLVNDKVILDIKNGKEFLKERGDEIVYEVYNLWKKIDSFKKIYEKTDIVSDVTIINHGVFSTSDSGELFSTYGHLHETEMGEVHLILKNGCFLMLFDKKSYETFILELKEGDFVFIHPKFLHRSIVFKKDCLLITFAPQKAGHDYLAVKGKGFPFHLFYDKKKNKLSIRKNGKYKKGKYKVVKKIRKGVDFLKLLERDPEKLKEILENPGRHEKLYFMGDKN